MIKAPRGTLDVKKEEKNFKDAVLEELFYLSSGYGFEKIQTPIFEEAILFNRSIGVDVDVNKEMYTFLDRKNREMALRPELTAPIVRSYIENKMYAQNPKEKLSYFGPCFRYERPQAGRYRQFNQFGVESFGVHSPEQDAEIIILGYSILKNFNLHNNVKLKINTLGNSEERVKYNEALESFLKENSDSLCNDCQNRINTNPLRILDCKIDGNSEVLNGAPKLWDYLSEESKEYFNRVINIIDQLDINYEIDYTLVRGLDYYNDTIFEFVAETQKAQATIIGGGRYNSLVKNLGGPEVPAIGFGLGFERLIEMIIELNLDIMEQYVKQTDVYFTPLTNEATAKLVVLMGRLRYEGLRCEMDYGDMTLKKGFKEAEKLGAIFIVIVGEDELKENKFKIKNLATKEEKLISESDLIDDLLRKGADE